MARKKVKRSHFTHRKQKKPSQFGHTPKFTDKEKELYRIWSTPDSAAAFSGQGALLREAKHQGISVKLTEVVQFLNKLQTYQTFFPRRRRFKRAKVYSRGNCCCVYTFHLLIFKDPETYIKWTYLICQHLRRPTATEDIS